MKNKFYAMFLILVLFTVGCFNSKPSFASEEFSNVNTEYKLYDDLSEIQKKSIIKEIPSINIIHDEENFTLVYKNTSMLIDKKDKLPLDTNVHNNTNVKSLPKTGSVSENFLLYIFGGILILLTIILFRYKKNKMMHLIILFILSALLIPYSNTYANEPNLPGSVTKKLQKNSSFYIEDTNINGYEYLGYIYTYSDNETPVIPEKGNLIVKYISVQGVRIAEDVYLSGKIGEAYTIEKKELDGYELKEVKGELSGFFNKDNKEVTLIYEKIPLPEKKESTVEFIIESSVEPEVTVFVSGEDGSSEPKKFPILYYVWEKNDLQSKVEDLKLTGIIGSEINLPNYYSNLLSFDGDTYVSSTIYPVYNDGESEQIAIDTPRSFHITIKNLAENPSIPELNLFPKNDMKIPVYIYEKVPA